MTFIYRFESEVPPVTPLRLKIEVNTREHFAVLGFTKKTVVVDNPWFSAQSDAVTYELEELLGTKLRAFYQRKKGRDLFDLAVALSRRPGLDSGKVIECFQRYMEDTGARVSRAEFEANLADKLADPVFHGDIAPLLAMAESAEAAFDVTRAAEAIMVAFIARLPGEPWKGPRE
jgi:hypothetical protein